MNLVLIIFLETSGQKKKIKMIYNLPTEIIPMIVEHLDVKSRKNFILVCKRFLNIVRSDPKITGKGLKIRPKKFRYNVDFMNALFLNWPSLKYLELKMKKSSPENVAKFLDYLEFENCESLESVEVDTPDMTEHFYPGARGKRS